QTRGARSLINGADVRLGVDAPGNTSGFAIMNGKYHEEIAMVLCGFARVRGQFPLVYLSRVRDENGDAMGYSVLSGPKLLFNEEREAAYAKLPDRFRFKDAKHAFGKGPQATTDFLNKCIGLGLLRKVGRTYEKQRAAD